MNSINFAKINLVSLQKKVKKLLLLIAGLFASCGKSECQYSKMTKITYNLNDNAAMQVVGTDNLQGCYTVTKTNGEANLNNSDKDFNIKITTNPNVFYISDDGSKHVFKETDGFKLGNTMSGDTLILQCLPTAAMSSEFLRFGIVYKFYN